MAGRALAFSDPDVIRLASEHFIPVAENCSPLQRQQDAKGDFFRLVAEQGHYAGRTFPTSTRQGIYTFTADGKVLSAVNTRDAEKMREMMETALERWQRLQSGGAISSGEAPGDYVPAYPDQYPTGGLVLRVAVRDLPRQEDTRADDWRKNAWNLDFAWFTRDEAHTLVPTERTAGARTEAPQPLLNRLARFHLRDVVRGEAPVWPQEALRHARLESEITAVDGPDGATIQLRLTGAVRLDTTLRWVAPESGQQFEVPAGFDCTLAGEATWDAPRGAFTRFDLVAAGSRWGRTQYNSRGEDLGPAPMGVAFSLAGAEPRDRTPPHQILHREYFR